MAGLHGNLPIKGAGATQQQWGVWVPKGCHTVLQMHSKICPTSHQTAAAAGTAAALMPIAAPRYTSQLLLLRKLLHG
jgi:hypothetical protein